MKQTLTKSVYRRELASFGGLDLRGASGEESRHRFVRLENLWRDYCGGEDEALETFPGYRCLTQFQDPIHGIWEYSCQAGTYLVVHAGKSLYLVDFYATDGATLTKAPVCPPGAQRVLSDGPSTAFSWGEKLYLLDGTHYFVLEFRDGGFDCSLVEGAYTPITYADDRAYEQRNLLCDQVISRVNFGVVGEMTYVQDHLQFTILDKALRTCEVSGMPRTLDRYPTKLYIPSVVEIGGLTYRVVQVGWKSFSQLNTIEEVYIGEGVTTICTAAFDCCRGLKVVYLPDSLVEIQRIAFQNCPLEKLVIGESLTTVFGDNFNTRDTSLQILFHGYGTTFADQLKVESDGNDAYFAATKTYVERYPQRTVYMRMHDEVSEVVKVTLDGVEVGDSDTALALDVISKDGAVNGLLLTAKEGYFLEGRTLEATCKLQNKGETSMTALTHCRGACLYDGRVFFWGNPQMPNTIYFSSLDRTGRMNPAYVGVYNHFDVGVGNNPNRALIPTASYLAVIKEGMGDEGAIHFYFGKDTGDALIPRIYEREAFVAGRGCRGSAINFMDDPVYLSDMGVEALGYQSLSMERVVHHRSTLIDAAIATHSPATCLMTEWEGYLVLLYPTGELYLGDGRRTCSVRGETQYEWYHLTGVGAYQDDLPVFRYATGYGEDEVPVVLYGGKEMPLHLHPQGDRLPLGSEYDTYEAVYPHILSGVDTKGTTRYFTCEEQDGKTVLYLLYQTRERTGGTFCPPTALYSGGGKLFFGCANGTLCVVNTDQRNISDTLEGQPIERDWYSYGGHRILSGFMTVPDDCGVGNYTKKTQRGTSVLEMKNGFDSGVTIQVNTHHGAYASQTEAVSFWGGGLDFATLSFDRLTFTDRQSHVVSLEERTKRWVSKQYSLWSDAFCQPFGVRRIGYSFSVEGKVKNR